MKIITTSDWHLGNLFHGNDRLPEHKHFIDWLLQQLKEQQPDALLIAGDIFDNGNPSAAAQSTYYEFLADATQECPDMRIVITAGNHDSASRLEAPRALLTRHHVEIRGNVKRTWNIDTEGGGSWEIDYDDLLIPIGNKAIVLAVPYLRSDIVQNQSYSTGVNDFLHNLTNRAKELYPDCMLIMMAHMYATGAEIASCDASEKIIIGGQEQVDMRGWTGHPDYLTCGHIHKRQHIWGTDWARYTGSVLPMSFAEQDYVHSVDLVIFEEGCKPKVEHLIYEPQHKLRVLPKSEDYEANNGEEYSPKKLMKLMRRKLKDRGAISQKTRTSTPCVDGKLSDSFEYLFLKVRMDKVSNDDIKAIEDTALEKDVVLCKIQKIMPNIDLTTISGDNPITSIDDILNRDPMDTIRETFMVKQSHEMNEEQEAMLDELLSAIKNTETSLED